MFKLLHVWTHRHTWDIIHVTWCPKWVNVKTFQSSVQRKAAPGEQEASSTVNVLRALGWGGGEAPSQSNREETPCDCVPRCRSQVWGKPCRVPARTTARWCTGRWWWQRGSLRGGRTPWSRTSRTSSAALRQASLLPHTGRCPRHTGTSLAASEGTQKEYPCI